MSLMSQTKFLGSLFQPAPDSNKTRIVRDLMAGKNYPVAQVRLLGCRRDGMSTFYYFHVPSAVVEIEIFWDPAVGRYVRRFSDVFDRPDQLRDMLAEDGVAR